MLNLKQEQVQGKETYQVIDYKQDMVAEQQVKDYLIYFCMSSWFQRPFR